MQCSGYKAIVELEPGGGLVEVVGSRCYVEGKTTSPDTLKRKGQIALNLGVGFEIEDSLVEGGRKELFGCNVAAQSGSHMSSCASALAVQTSPGSWQQPGDSGATQHCSVDLTRTYLA
jgi:hypothetical protein